MESISTLSQAFSNLPGSSSIFLVEAEFTARVLLLPRLHRQVYAQALAQSISENVEWHSMAQQSHQFLAALSCQQFCDYVEAFHLRLHWEITGRFTPVATSFATNFFRNSSNFLPSLRQKQSARLPWNLRHRWNSNSATRRNF